MKQSGLVTVLLIALAYGAGFSVGNKNLVFDGYRPQLVKTEIGKPKDIDFSLFWEVWDRVNDKYVGKVDNQAMVYDAINGALSSLDDPYTLFLPPDEAKRFDEDLKGSFDGIGAEIEKRDGNITIVAPLEDSPAEKAGVKAKDIILKIDELETKDLTIDEAINKIRGAKGSQVKLTVYREGESQPLTLAITRDTIVVKSVKSEIKGDTIAYLKLNIFGDDTVELTSKALDELLAKKPKGLILDLRNNPGGFLDTAVDVSSLFVKDRGAMVKEENKAGKLTELKATLAAKATDVPMIVLVNGGSASASEIVAGALQDYGRAKLVGEKTFGKGSVQELDDVKGGGAVRVTVAKWLTPKGRQINKEGITPDIEVKLGEEDEKNNKDPQLERAMAELQK